MQQQEIYNFAKDLDYFVDSNNFFTRNSGASFVMDFQYNFCVFDDTHWVLFLLLLL